MQPINEDVQPYALWLWALTALFAIRVISQPLALVIDFRWLPRFESWHSGVMPYPLLVVAQLFILGARDMMTPPRAAQDLSRAIAGSKTVTIAPSGHSLMAEAPDAGSICSR